VPVGEQLRRVGPGGLVGALPDRPEAEDGHLPGVPVAEAVEAEDLAEGGVARGVPSLRGIIAAVGRGRQECREEALLRDELQKVSVPGAVDVVVDERLLTAVLEELNGGVQQPARLGVEVRWVVRVRVEQQRFRYDGVPGLISGR
jgi:hypothetical protein